MSGSEQFGGGIAVVDEGERRHKEVDNTRLVLYASAVRRPGDLLPTVLERMRAYNTIVAEVIASVESQSARIMKYVGDGVLISFPPDDIAVALRCVGCIVDRLGSLQRSSDGGALESCMGLSAGEVQDVTYLHSAPGDHIGQPIEIAARLVSDVAKPRQILLDHAAKVWVEERHLTELGSLMPKAQLRPARGQSLMIEGMIDPMPVFELVWEGQKERKIQNRQRLWDELTKIKDVTLDLRSKLGARPSLTVEQWDEETVKVSDVLRDLNLRSPRSEIARVKKMTRGSAEAGKLSELVKRAGNIETRFKRLKRVWDAHNRDGWQGTKAAINEVTEAYDVLIDEVRWFYDEVDNSLRALEEQA